MINVIQIVRIPNNMKGSLSYARVSSKVWPAF